MGREQDEKGPERIDIFQRDGPDRGRVRDNASGWSNNELRLWFKRAFGFAFSARFLRDASLFVGVVQSVVVFFSAMGG